MGNKIYPIIACLMALAMTLSGCGNAKPSAGDTTPKANEAKVKDDYKGDPVTLTVWNQAAGILTDDDLETFIGKPVRAKYPNISFQLVKGKLEDLISSGEIPDLITTSDYYLYGLKALELPDDLSPMIKKESVDMKRFEPVIVDAMKQFGDHGEIYGMPFALNYGVTVYNKDIFDKFAVPYPKDNMTWNQMIELGRKLTRQDGENAYIGFDPGAAQTLVRADSLPVMDEKQEKAVMNSDPIKKIFSLLQSVYSIPGFISEKGKYSYGFNDFQQDKKLAILPYWLAALTSRVPLLNDAGINWDITSYPTFEGRPEYGREVDFHLVVVTSTSKHKEDAYRALTAIVTDDAQKEMNKNVRLTVLNDPALRKEFASDLKYFDGKNLSGVFKVKPSPLPMVSKYDENIYSYLRSAAGKMVKDHKDINTALREAEEEANKYVQEQNSTK